MVIRNEDVIWRLFAEPIGVEFQKVTVVNFWAVTAPKLPNAATSIANDHVATSWVVEFEAPVDGAARNL